MSPDQATRVAIVSDTHAELHPQIAGLIRQADIAIHAGDICDGRVLDSMQPRSGRVLAVTGNNDQECLWPADQVDQVRALRAIETLELPGGLVAIEHGHQHDMMQPDHDDLRRAHPQARLVVYGHTHKKVIDDYKTPWVVNPGAAGRTRTRGGASCLILNACETLWTIESYRFTDPGILHNASSAA